MPRPRKTPPATTAKTRGHTLFFMSGANCSDDYCDFRYEGADEANLPAILATRETQSQILDRINGGQSAVSRTSPAIAAFCLEQLRLAHYDLTSTTPQAREARTEARAWIARAYDYDDPCVDVASFEGCCLTLGIEPTDLRTKLLAIGVPSPRKRGPMPRRTPTIQPVVRFMPPRRGRPPRVLVAVAA